jgi:hypothetical protein
VRAGAGNFNASAGRAPYFCVLGEAKKMIEEIAKAL